MTGSKGIDRGAEDMISGRWNRSRTRRTGEGESPLKVAWPAVVGKEQPTRTRRVAMVGPSADMAKLGGVAAVERVLLDEWRVSRYALDHVATHEDAGPGRRLAVALRAGRALFGGFLARSIDLLHLHFVSRGSFWRKSGIVLLARLFGVPVVGHLHPCDFQGFYEGLGPLRRAYVRMVLNSFDRIIVLTDEWRNWLVRLYRRSEPVILPDPVAVPAMVRRERQGPPVLLTYGRFGANKGTYDILRAIPTVLERFPDAQFWIGGDSEVDARVREMIKDESWAGRVRLIGWVSGTEKEAALVAAHAFLMPAHGNGLPMAVLEAMAWGVPVVATPVRGLTSAVVDGETGLVVPVGDSQALAGAIVRLLKDPDRAETLGMAGRQMIAERHEAGLILERLEVVYDEVAG